MMNIKDFRKRTLKFNMDIAVAITKLVHAFEEETGYTPSDISINMFEHFDIEVQRSKHVVDSVDTTIDF